MTMRTKDVLESLLVMILLFATMWICFAAFEG